MRPGRFTIARLVLAIMACAVVFAGLRSGSNDWFKSIYTSTFLVLVYSVIVARYRGAFWHGFAVAGWAFFLVGIGPWIASPDGEEPYCSINRNLVTAIIPEVLSMGMPKSVEEIRSSGNMLIVKPMVIRSQAANVSGIAQCALTVLFALGGGLVGEAVGKRPKTDE